MKPLAAKKLAQKLMEENCEEGSFQVELAEQELAIVAQILESDFKCAVQRHEFRPILNVICPPNLED